MYNISSAQRNMYASLIVNNDTLNDIGYISNVIYIMYINITSNIAYISNH